MPEDNKKKKQVKFVSVPLIQAIGLKSTGKEERGGDEAYGFFFTQ